MWGERGYTINPVWRPVWTAYGIGGIVEMQLVPAGCRDERADQSISRVTMDLAGRCTFTVPLEALAPLKGLRVTFSGCPKSL